MYSRSLIIEINGYQNSKDAISWIYQDNGNIDLPHDGHNKLKYAKLKKAVVNKNLLAKFIIFSPYPVTRMIVLMIGVWIGVLLFQILFNSTICGSRSIMLIDYVHVQRNYTCFILKCTVYSHEITIILSTLTCK